MRNDVNGVLDKFKQNKIITKIIDNKKIFTLLLSIVAVIVVLINSTYSLMVRTDETDLQSYSTGMLEITSSVVDNSVQLTNSLPMTDADGVVSTPYKFKITNTGNLDFKFNVKLLSTSTNNQIDSQYIRVMINTNPISAFSELSDGVILKDIFLASGESVELELRVWLQNDTPNTQLGKVFNAKIVTEGQAVYSRDASLQTLINLGLDKSVSVDMPDFTKTSCSDSTVCDETTVGLYSSKDDLGTTYYFRGDVTNNYVKFGKNSSGADMYWRIIRINGDGSIRMIYDGTAIHDNGVLSSDKRIGTGAYNNDKADNAYVGFMYGNAGSDLYTDTHANINSSTIKNTLNTWYGENIAGTSYEQYVADAIYCNDRSLGNNGNGIGTTPTRYNSYHIAWIKNTMPSFKCLNMSDRFTQSTKIGNGKLSDSYPIALITAAEANYAGAVGATYKKENNKFYLYSGYNIWTMSPVSYGSSLTATISALLSNGKIDNNTVSTTYSIRPVISIKGDAIKSGNGTMDNPYSVTSGANPPELTNGLVPVMYNGTTWVVADATNSNPEYEWYDYDKQKWANAVLVDANTRQALENTKDANGNYEAGTVIGESEADGVLAFYVWIPRYKYKVWNIDKIIGKDTYDAYNKGIDIKFIKKDEEGSITCAYSYAAPVSTAGSPNETCTDSTGSGYYTHPAFKFGDDNVSGFWMGKFELSSSTQSGTNGGGTSSTYKPKILPNVMSWRYNTVSNFWYVINQMQATDNIYGLSTDLTVADSHMLTNMEWGAVAYLTHSEYGRCATGICEEVAINNSGNSNNTTYTGRSAGVSGSGTISYSDNGTYTYEKPEGQKASTTGNIYGIYDLSGGAHEYVMGNMSSESGKYTYNQQNASDLYSYEGFEKYITTYAYGTSYASQIAYNRGRLGDATAEVAIKSGVSNGGWFSDQMYYPYTTTSSGTYSWFLRGGYFNSGLSSGIFRTGRVAGGRQSSYSTRATLFVF